MSRKDKLLARLKSRPKDFTFDELTTLLESFGYALSNQGSSSGSRVAFHHPVSPPILLHKPHPGNELRDYQVRQVLDVLRQEGIA